VIDDASNGHEPRTIRRRDLLPLAAGLGTLALATVSGWDARLVEAITSPPVLVRAMLVGIAVVVGLALLARSVARFADAGLDDVPALVRAVRLAFLAVAAFAAAGGWILAHPLPIVVAGVIAAIDVIETSFLLLVIGPARRLGRRRD
jgi:hypothetical protein